MKIRCPKCYYEPTSEDKWVCSCGWIWNTFDTMGHCPQCGKIWWETQCLSCHHWSAHHQWYYYDPPKLLEEEKVLQLEESSQIIDKSQS